MSAVRLLLLLLALGSLGAPAEAASRFWNPYIVTGAVSGTGGVCRLTISPAIVGGGLTTSNTVIVTNITGATGCNVTAAISAVVDSTHIELTGTTFGGAYVSGGCVAGGNWTSTNTANWASSSTATCGSGGQTVPASGDTVTLDANSLGGTIIPNFNIALGAGSFTWGAFTGTIDFSVNNVNFAAATFSGTGAATKTFKCGSGTYTIAPAALTALTPFTLATSTNLTWTCGSETWNINEPSAVTNGFNTIQLGSTSLTYGTMNFGSTTSGGTILTETATQTFGHLGVTAPNSLQLPPSSTLIVSNPFALTGTSSAPIFLTGGAGIAAVNAPTGAYTGAWVQVSGVNFTTSSNATFTFTSSLRTFHGASDVASFSPPSGGGGGGGLIGGYLLNRDLPGHANDNQPAFVRRAS